VNNAHLYIWLSLQLRFSDGFVQFVKPSVIIAFANSCVGSAMNDARTPNPMLPEKEGFELFELKHAWLAFAKCSAQWTILNADLSGMIRIYKMFRPMDLNATRSLR